MDTQTMDRDVVDRPVVDPWRRAPTRTQITYATDLCRSELPYAERVRTIATFEVLDQQAMSELIGELAAMRERRLARLRRARRRRR
jgi:hypothetical protein